MKYFTKPISEIKKLEDAFASKPAVYLFKYDMNSFLYNLMDMSNDEIINMINNILVMPFYEEKHSIVGLYYDTTILLRSEKLGEKKEKLLSDFLKLDREYGFSYLIELFEIMTKNMPPLYVGKANDLQVRIGQHISGNSSDLSIKLEKYKLDINNCVIHYYYVDDSFDEKTNELLEDILTRVLKPGFVRRIG